jgi:hypothetical protein
VSAGARRAKNAHPARLEVPNSRRAGGLAGRAIGHDRVMRGASMGA